MVYCEWTILVVPGCNWFRSVVSFTRQVELQSTEALMPQMTDERVCAGLTHEEDLSLYALKCDDVRWIYHLHLVLGQQLPPQHPDEGS